MTQLGLPFIQRPSDINEDPRPGETPLRTQHRITLQKAWAARPVPGQTVIACDTTVLLDREMLNKPADAGEAWAMLRRLRGRAHQVQSCLVVLSGAAAGDAGDSADEVAASPAGLDIVTSEVWMRDYSDDAIASYIASGDPYDKAGSYAVQHPQFRPVTRIQGCPLNVIGLPLCVLRRRLPHVPASGPVCAAWFGCECPAHAPDDAHSVSGQPPNLKFPKFPRFAGQFP